MSIDQRWDSLLAQQRVPVPLRAGYIMWAALLLGFPFAMWYPRMAKSLKVRRTPDPRP